MQGEAFSRVIIDSQLADQGWKTTDATSVRFEYPLADLKPSPEIRIADQVAPHPRHPDPGRNSADKGAGGVSGAAAPGVLQLVGK